MHHEYLIGVVVCVDYFRRDRKRFEGDSRAKKWLEFCIIARNNRCVTSSSWSRHCASFRIRGSKTELQMRTLYWNWKGRVQAGCDLFTSSLSCCLLSLQPERIEVVYTDVIMIRFSTAPACVGTVMDISRWQTGARYVGVLDKKYLNK